MLDLSSRRPSEVYSEKLGEELFRLDADSFARSTYVPQLSASDVEATTSIRTKLSNLVEDTNDLSNYDTAEKKLRDYRTKFRAYRGNGGIINEVRDKHLTLENQKDQAEQQKPRLQDIVEEIEQLNREKTAKTEDVSVLREKIRRASYQKARQVTQRHLGELRTDISKNQQYLHEMDKNYPAGYPTPEEIKTQRENLSVIQQERQRLQALKFNNADREIVDREQQWFADNDKVVSDIDHCDQDCKELGEVSAKVTAQMLPEELERLKILSERFKSSLPTEEELQKYMDIADELSDAQHRQADLSIPVENQKCLARLKELFGSGMPSDSVLDACEQAQHDRDVLKQSRAVHGFPESEQQQYEALKRTFASCVPTEDEIRDKQKDSRRIAELITRKNTQTTIVQQERVRETPPALKMPLLCGGAGVVFLIVGIVGLVLNFLIPGTILLVIGFGALFASFWLHTQSAIKNQKQGTTSVIKASAISDAENQELYDLQHGYKYTDLKQKEKRSGNLRRYDVGSVAEINGLNNEQYFILGLTYFDNELRAHVEKIDYIKAIASLVKYISERSQGFSTYMPVIGTGGADAGSVNDLVVYIVKTIELFKDEIDCDIHIVVSDKEEKLGLMNMKML